MQRLFPVAAFAGLMVVGLPAGATSPEAFRESILAGLDRLLDYRVYVTPSFLCHDRNRVKLEIASLVGQGLLAPSPTYWDRPDDKGLVSQLTSVDHELTVRLRGQDDKHSVSLRVDKGGQLSRLFYAVHRTDPDRSRSELLHIVDAQSGGLSRVFGYRLTHLDPKVNITKLSLAQSMAAGLGALFPSRVGLVLEALGEIPSFKHKWSYYGNWKHPVSGDENGWRHVVMVRDPVHTICGSVHGVHYSQALPTAQVVHRFRRVLRSIGAIPPSPPRLR